MRRGSDLFRSESRIEKARAALRAEDAKDAESAIAVFATVKQERRAAGGGGASEAGKAHAAAEATTAEMVACVTPRPKAHPAPIRRRTSGKRRCYHAAPTSRLVPTARPASELRARA